jgi:hypothetical protein
MKNSGNKKRKQKERDLRSKEHMTSCSKILKKSKLKEDLLSS